MSSPRSLLLLFLAFIAMLGAGGIPTSALAETAEEFVASQLRAGKKANRLIHELSPYLLKHAFNPVDWYPWGEEPFRRAVEEGKPVLLSIGYSTCHWCNVMEEESFDNTATADFLNRHFIAVKVDREEHPDVDRLYMQASFALTGKGGWPLTLFLTPDKKPFYAGTYFPAERSLGQPSFMELLTAMRQAWQTRKDELGLQATEVIAGLLPSSGSDTGKTIDWHDVEQLVFRQLRDRYDPVRGGFGRGSKFPRPVALSFLLRFGSEIEESTALAMVEKTLKEMAEGGIFDHLGGGFHRYSVDPGWRTPHFEKMLYDQAQLASVYLDAFRLTGKADFGLVAKAIFDYVSVRLTDAHGGFFSAEDADSPVAVQNREKREGAYYVWKADEVAAIVGEKNWPMFGFAFGLEENGNAVFDPRGELSGMNILYRAHGVEQTAARFGASPSETAEILQGGLRKLAAVREKRPRPYLDDKIIAAWNGLMISSLAAAFEVFGEDRYLEGAVRAGQFLFGQLYDEQQGVLYRSFRKERAAKRGVLLDYACVARAYLDLFRATQDIAWLRRAEKLSENMLQRFSEADGTRLSETEADAALPAKVSAGFEGAEPSGLAIAGLVFQQLAALLGDRRWRGAGEKVLENAASLLAEQPAAMPALAETVSALLRKPRQIILVGNHRDEGLRKMIREVFLRYLPGASLIVLDRKENRNFFAERLPETVSMQPLQGRSTAYVCEDFSCKLPTTDFEVFQALLR